MASLRQQFLAAASLVAEGQQGLSCLALREVGVSAPDRAAYLDWLDESNSETKSHDLWMKFGGPYDPEARAHRIIALLTYAETL
jgi:hypothetical protein